MSTQAMQLAIGLMKSGDFDGARLKVLMYLAWKHDWRSGFAWPAMATIATETGIEERSVRRIMHYLEDRGVLRITRGNGAGHLTRYEFPGLAAEAIVADTKGDTISQKGGHSEPERGTQTTEKGDRDQRAIRKEKQGQKEEQKPTSSSAPDDDAGGIPAAEVVDRILRAFEENPVTTGRAKAVDLTTARELLRSFTPQQIEYGILLGSARRIGSGIEGEVQTLAYFTNSISEAAIDGNCSDSYAQYLRRVLSRYQQGKRRAG